MSRPVPIILPPPNWQALAVWGLAPLSVGLVLLWAMPAEPAASLVVWVTSALIVAIMLLLIACVRHNRADIVDGRLLIRAGLLFHRKVPLDQVAFDQVEILYAPRSVREWIGWRVFGIGMPGFHAGWFRKDGRWVFVQALRNAPALRLPTRGRADIVLAVATPQDALAKLRNAAKH